MFDGSQKRYMSYEQLKTIDPDEALGIDMTRKEDHLHGWHYRNNISLFCEFSDAEFVQVFGMDRRSFAMQPKWKQDNKKKAVGLF